jgi:hypothetical protein
MELDAQCEVLTVASGLVEDDSLVAPNVRAWL